MVSTRFKFRPSMGVLTNSDFAHTTSLAEATQKRLSSRVFPDPAKVKCETVGEKSGTGVKLTFTVRVDGLEEDAAVLHKFFFIERSETRETAHILTPEQPEASTTLLVAFDDGITKDYFNASVYDNEGRVIATDSIVFSSEGRIVTYPFTEKYVSPLSLRDATLAEETRDNGEAVVRFRVKLHEVAAETKVHLLWEAMGHIRRETTVLTPGREEAVLEMLIEGASTTIPSDWIAIAVDDQERVIAQTAFALVPA